MGIIMRVPTLACIRTGESSEIYIYIYWPLIPLFSSNTISNSYNVNTLGGPEVRISESR